MTTKCYDCAVVSVARGDNERYYMYTGPRPPRQHVKVESVSRACP